MKVYVVTAGFFYESDDDRDGLLRTDFFFLAFSLHVGVSLKNVSCSAIFTAQLFLVQVLVLDTSASHTPMSTPIFDQPHQ